MATRFESKIGKVANTDVNLYNFLTDFRNYESFIPADKVKNFEASEESCSFEIDMVGRVGLQIIEKETPKLIKIGADEQEKKEFFLWIQIKEAAPGDSRVKITMEIELNPMMKMMASKPLQNFVDTLAEQMSKLDNV